MISINVVKRDGTAITVAGSSDLTLMEAIRDNGVDELLGLCGAQVSCSTCHVYIDPAFAAFLPPVSDFEDDLLHSSDHREPRSRLACQINCVDELDGINVEVAPEN
jgi:2Fe-2S ferredoxin